MASSNIGKTLSLSLACPRCDRVYVASNINGLTQQAQKEHWDKLKFHVSEQHPDHDPLWFETGDYKKGVYGEVTND